MNCSELEILICDYVDGTLAPAERAEVERHLSTCAGCSEMARDGQSAVAFMERAAEVEAPPELITRILFDPPWSNGKGRLVSGIRGRISGILNGVLQPRFVMGMAMTIVSFSMLARFVTPVRQLRPADLQPAKVWAALEDRGVRAWARSVKFYENLKFVYQIQSTLREWQQQQEEEQRQAGDPEPAGRGDDGRKLPVTPPPEQPDTAGEGGEAR
jgi:anti-sigma factor RsiW